VTARPSRKGRAVAPPGRGEPALSPVETSPPRTCPAPPCSRSAVLCACGGEVQRLPSPGLPCSGLDANFQDARASAHLHGPEGRGARAVGAQRPTRFLFTAAIPRVRARRALSVLSREREIPPCAWRRRPGGELARSAHAARKEAESTRLRLTPGRAYTRACAHRGAGAEGWRRSALHHIGRWCCNLPRFGKAVNAGRSAMPGAPVGRLRAAFQNRGWGDRAARRRRPRPVVLAWRVGGPQAVGASDGPWRTRSVSLRNVRVAANVAAARTSHKTAPPAAVFRQGGRVQPGCSHWVCRARRQR